MGDIGTASGSRTVRSRPGCVDVSLSETPNPPIACYKLVGGLNCSHLPSVVNEKHQLYSDLDKGAE